MPATSIAQFKAAVAQAVARMLPAAPRQNCKPTVLHDAVWGTVRLAPHEVALLDTPLFQRLRHLRQLGSAYLLFPGAHHTRFEHTLGVTHLTATACAALVRRSATAVTPAQQDNLRLAALCHDLGHGPFSHCSEMFFKNLAPVPTMLGGDAIGAAELLSKLIVTSAPLVEFIRQLNDSYATQLDPDFIVATIVKQLPPDQHYLSEIVHGPFDTDKLDYLSRDSKFCGINSAVDVDRILASLDFAPFEGRTHLVGRHGTVAALTQLIHHRNHMFTVIYQHRLTRTVAAMLRTALVCAHQDGTTVCDRQLVSAADFIELDDAWLLAPGSVAPSVAADLLTALRRRELYRTAGRIHGNLISEEQRAALNEHRAALTAAIAAQVGAREHEVIIDISARQNNQEVGDLLIKNGSQLAKLGDILELNRNLIPVQRYLEQHLILSSPQHSAAVAQAAPAVLAEVVPAAAWVAK